MGVPSWNMGLVFPCVTVATLCRGFETQQRLIFSHLCNLAWLVLYQHILHVTTVVTTLFTLWVYKGGSHYWEGHPTVRGPTVRQLSHTVFFFATRFFINLCCSKQGYFKQSYIKQHMKCLNLCNDFCVKILLLHFLKRTFPWTKGSILWQFTSESGIHYKFLR
jgi:hypothetical protein